MNNNFTKYLSSKAVKQAIYRGAAFSVILLLTTLGVRGQTWQLVGSADFSGNGDAWNTCISIDPGGVPYIVYEDATREDKATVMKFNGTSWVPVDTAGVTPGGAGAPAMTMDKYGTPYVIYSDGTNNDGATVMKHVGSGWQILGNAGFNGNIINFPSIAIDTNGNIYVAFIDAQYSSTLTVMKYVSGSWVPVGSPGFGSEYSAYSSIALDPSGTPYVACSDGYHGPATVRKFDGTNWVTVGSAGFTPTGTYSTFIKIDKYGTPYMTYAFGNGSYIYGDSAGVMKFNGTSWVSLNPTKFSVTAGNPNINIAIDSFGAPYVVFQDFHHAGAATVEAYNGTSWSAEGNIGFSAAGVQYPDITVTNSGTIYVAYMDQANNYGATVMELAGVSAVLGISNMCAGSSYTFSDASAGGTWSSSNTAVATVGASTGVVSAIGAGSTTISYTLGGTTVTSLLNVNPSPSLGAGFMTMCVGETVTLNGTPAGGTWTSNIPSSATVNSSGVVTAIGSGYGTIQYILSSGCSASIVMEINPAPAVSGPTIVCPGSSITLSSSPPYGTWSSGNTSVATVDVSGDVTGVSTGTVGISFTNYSGCVTIDTISVDPPPAAISGPTSVCTGSTITLTDGTPGGSWSTSNTSIITAGTGSYLSYVAGTATITYTAPSGCYVTTVITFNPQPGGISGSSEICAGSTTYYSDYPSGGMWSSGSTSVATVGTDGTVYGVSAGTASIIYTMPGGCDTSRVITIEPAPSAITGPTSVCTGSTIFLTDATPGGSWSAGSSSITLSDTGSVYGTYITGTATVTYTMPSGCYVTTIVTVNRQPSVISGSSEICAGATTYYSDYPSGGMWTSGSTSVATVGTDGTVYGVSAGTASISYTMPGGCFATTVITIQQSPAISGLNTICGTSTASLTATPTGGTWSSSNSSTAFVSGSGVITGVSAGTTNITYAIGDGCSSYMTVSDNPVPVINPFTVICTGTTVALGLITGAPGGTWSSSNTAAFVVLGSATSPYVWGVGPGTSTISYVTPGAGCTTSIVVTDNAVPVISGTFSLCGYSSTTLGLSAGVTGGTWSSSNSTVTIGSSSGTIMGVYPGTSTITYTTGFACTATQVVTDNAQPGGISGYGEICAGSTTYYSDYPSGGMWSSGSTSVATVGTDGTVYGVSAGTATIIYSAPGGCDTSKVITIDPAPSPIGGPSAVCVGSTITLTDATPGGYWSASGGTIYLTDTGTVTGETSGTAIVTYTMPSGCYVITVITISQLPGAVSGIGEICAGGTTSYSDYPSGGMWSSGSTSVATTGTDGTIYGIGAGTANISYTMPGGCFASSVITVDAAPSPISGPNTVCAGSTIYLTDATPGGSWSTSSPSIILSDTGSVLGYVPGTAVVMYIMPSGCFVSTVVVVNQVPSITGSSAICAGETTSYAAYPTGGMWSSGSTSVATVGTDGTVYGVGAGIANISYTLSGGCYASAVVTVNALPNITTGPGVAICYGGSTTLYVTGGVSYSWLPSTGLSCYICSNPVATPTVTTTYTVTGVSTSGCTRAASVTVTVGALTAGTIGGASSVNVGAHITLTDGVSGGVWSASNTNATVVSGLVTGVTAGTVIISYAVSGSCGTVYATKVITVNSTYVPGINGNTSICAGGTTSLSDAATGGTWSMSSLVATINGSTGIVTASNTYAGTATVTYTQGGGTATIVVTVNANPTPIQGATAECAGTTIVISDATGSGTWSATGDATISGAGPTAALVAGSTGGTATVMYTLASGCFVTITNTIYSNPLPIAGVFNVCVGSVTILSDSSPGSSWTSSNTAVASAAGADITGMTAGTAIITFKSSAAGSCITTQVINVSAQPTAISGNTGAICQGTALSLTDGSGIWTSSNATIATVGSTSGIVTGMAGGTATITYMASGAVGCVAKTTVTVSAAPTITGTATMCVGGTTTLHDAVAGGTWSSGSANASVSATGVVTGMASGTAVITYTTASGCMGMLTVTIGGTSAAISGNLLLCEGTSTTLSDASAGGTWSMSSGIASVVGSTGVVTASATLTGTATISYTTGGCSATAILTVNAKPTPIQGATYECNGVTVSLSDATTGGTWTISGDATITGAGASATLVAGATGGSALVTYTIGTGCATTMTNTIYSVQPITGNFSMCIGLVTILTDASSPGSWSSSSTAIAIASGPDISGEGAGTVTISFRSSAAGNCLATQVVTVSAMPVVTAINGPATISHAGSPVSISDATAGGVWTSSNTGVITLSGSTGSPIGASAVTTTGSSIVTYAVTNAGCTTKVTKTFSAAASSHPDGTTTVLAGTAVSLADDMPNGAWSSSDNGIATVDASGIVTGIMPGSVFITHEIMGDDGTESRNVTNVTVSAAPAIINVLPNPNKGTFIVRGTVGSMADEAVTLEVTDLLGQVIYRNNVTAFGGKLNETITLSNGLANGMYILNVKSGTEKKTFHFVIEQ